MEELDYLYHYTNIETLALILKNKTVRFNSLDKMDDLQEQQTADVKNIGQFCYISSWTDDSTESIPMWNMYASLDFGVRIRLCKNPFKIYETPVEQVSKTLNMNIKGETNEGTVRSIIPLIEMFEKGFYSIQAINQNLLYKVEYTNDNEKLYPHLLNENGDQFLLSLGDVGKHKNLHWQFQKEWRYILNILPLNMNQSAEAMDYDFQLVANKIKLGLEKQSFSYYDMQISENAFKEMEITLSPCLSEGNRVIVQALIEKYNPTASLKESSLIGLI